MSAIIELGNDEVYYWTYALDLQWNYFDHPPLVGWLIRLTTANLEIQQGWAVRLGAIICSSLCTIIIYRIGKLLANDRVGWYAVLLYSASFYCSIIAGTFILPDSPQMVFWLWGVLLMLRISNGIHTQQSVTKLWYMFGVVAGLCMMCKVHGIFLWIAMVIYLVFHQPKFLLKKEVYFAAAITVLLLSPVIIWNIQHAFITYTYHSNRVSLLNAAFNPISFGREIIGEIFYNNPLIFFLGWIAVFSTFGKKYSLITHNILILLYCALPLIIILLVFSAFRDTLPHWSGPGYTCLLLLVALMLDAGNPLKANKLIMASALIFIFIITIGLSGINFYPGTLSSEKTALHLGKGDPTLDLYGWKKTGELVDSLYHVDQLTSTSGLPTTIIVTKWFPAAHIDFYVGASTKLKTYALGDIFDLHQYYWLNKRKKKLSPGDNSYYIVPSNLYNEDDLAILKSHFKTCAAPIILPIYRSGILCKNILVFRLATYRESK